MVYAGQLHKDYSESLKNYIFLNDQDFIECHKGLPKHRGGK